MIDVHAHILPGVDDGARDMEESIRMLRRAAAQGIKAMIVTPHYSRQRTMPELEETFQSLCQAVWEWNPEFQLYLGQETRFHDELPDRLRDGIAYTMAQSHYVLVEFEPHTSFQTLCRGVRKLSNFGYYPILAHIERYACLRNKGNLRELCGMNCWLQMNYESIEGKFYDPEVRWCRRQVLEGRIDLLGTDMHRLDYRPPRVEPAMQWLRKYVDAKRLEDMTERNAMRILQEGCQKLL